MNPSVFPGLKGPIFIPNCYIPSASVLYICQLGDLGKLVICELQFPYVSPTVHSVVGKMRQICARKALSAMPNSWEVLSKTDYCYISII